MKPSNSGNAPAPHGHYVQAQSANGFLTSSIQLPVDPNNNDNVHWLVSASFEEQAEQLYRNFSSILESAGCGVSDIVRLTLYVAEIDDWQTLDDIAKKFFGDHKPARGVIAVPSIHKGYKIAGDFIAETPQTQNTDDSWSTADLSDSESSYTTLDCDWKHYGNITKFSGIIETIKITDSNTELRELLSTAGNQRVAVVQANGPDGKAVVGDQLAKLAIENNWAGIVVYGKVRDTTATKQMPIGITALGTCPTKSQGDTKAIIGQPIQIGETTTTPGTKIYVDQDGIVTQQN